MTVSDFIAGLATGSADCVAKDAGCEPFQIDSGIHIAVVPGITSGA
jgi:hypothetical protein